jgi:hypothetical protein
MANQCPICGSGVSDIARFCGRCGKKLPDTAASMMQTVPLPQHRSIGSVVFAPFVSALGLGENDESTKLFIGGLVLMLVAACALLAYILFLLRDATPAKLL